jgi:hypothetical protein
MFVTFISLHTGKKKEIEHRIRYVHELSAPTEDGVIDELLELITRQGVEVVGGIE